MPSSCKRMLSSLALMRIDCFRVSTDTRARLMKEASINAKQAGERGISAKNVKKVTEVRLERLSSYGSTVLTNI